MSELWRGRPGAGRSLDQSLGLSPPRYEAAGPQARPPLGDPFAGEVSASLAGIADVYAAVTGTTPGEDPAVQDTWHRLRADSRWTPAPHDRPPPPRRDAATANFATSLGHGDPPPHLDRDPVVERARRRVPGEAARAAGERAPPAPPRQDADVVELRGAAAPPRTAPPRMRFEPTAGNVDVEVEVTDAIPLPPAPPPREDGPARSFCERLARRAALFRAQIGPEREIGVRLSPVFGEPVYVDDVTHDGPDMIVLLGTTKLGVRVQVVQHVSQANVWFVAMNPR